MGRKKEKDKKVLNRNKIMADIVKLENDLKKEIRPGMRKDIRKIIAFVKSFLD